MNIYYPAKITYDKTDGRYFIQFIDLSEAITEAESFEEALFNAAEVLTLTLEARLDEKQKIPKPSKAKTKNTHMIAPFARVQSALLMRFSKGEYRISDIARAMETSWPAVARLENPHHWPSLKQLERAAFAIGKRLVLSFESANG